MAGDCGKNVEEDRDREQAKARDQHPGDCSRAERHGQTALQRRPGRLGRADISPDRYVHADEAGQAGQQRADEEADRGDRSKEIIYEGDDDYTDDRDGAVLAGEVGLRALLHSARDVPHPLVTGRRLQHLHGGHNSVEYGNDAADNRDKQQVHEFKLPRFLKSGCCGLGMAAVP